MGVEGSAWRKTEDLRWDGDKVGGDAKCRHEENKQAGECVRDSDQRQPLLLFVFHLITDMWHLYMQGKHYSNHKNNS